MPNLRGVAAAVLTGAVGYSVWLVSGWGGEPVIRVADDVGLVVFAAFAGVSAVIAARSCSERDRTAWTAVAVGVFGWAVGAAVWSYFDLVADTAPFPSLADVGYLTFLGGIALFLVLQLRSSPHAVQFRVLLDSVIVGAALFGATWVLAFETVFAAGLSDPVQLVLTLVYPVVDIVLLTVVLMMLARAPRRRRPGLILVTVALVSIALSDGAYAYFTAVDGYDGQHVIALGWAWGFTLLGFAGLLGLHGAAAQSDVSEVVPSRLSLWLPYVPVVVAAMLCAPALLDGAGPLVVATTVGVFAVLARLFLSLGENRRLLAEAAHQSLHDPVTGVASRRLFNDRLSHAMALHSRHGLGVGVLRIDLDLDLSRALDDQPGEPAGEALLVGVAERLTATVRDSDTVARLGDGHFAVLMEGDGDFTRATAQRVVAAFDRPVVAGETAEPVRPSVGLAHTDAAAEMPTAAQLWARANVAVTVARGAGDGALVTYHPAMGDAGAAAPEELRHTSRSTGSANLLEELREALEHRQLTVYYQPKFDLRSGRIIGLEALVRWVHPRWGILGPDQFLPLVRRYGLTHALTGVVLEVALDDAARWYAAGVGMPVAINVFAPVVGDPELCDQIGRALDERGLPPQCLTVEITEDLLLDSMGNCRSVFNQLRSNGVRVAIDDFGSGYSALWYLREFPVDEVKLGKEFVAPVLTHPASAAIVRAVVDLAHALGVTAVAEGIENGATAERLRSYGCEVAQGYYYSPPLPAALITQMLEAQQRGRLVTPGDYSPEGARRSEIELMQ